MEKNKNPLESLTAALAYAMGVEPPEFAAAPNEELTAYIDRCLAGKKADRVFIYNTDAIAQWVFEKYPYITEGARNCTELALPMLCPNPPKTPVCFGTMYTGAAPKVHGIEQYEKKRINIDTLFDALVRAGKKVAVITRPYYSMAVIFADRPFDYHFCPTWPEVNAKAVELIMKDEYDFILTYNANFDDIMHRMGPESIECLSEMRFNYQTYCMFDSLIRTHWKHHNVLIGTGMDHGCHTIERRLTKSGILHHGTHEDDSAEDRNIIHLYKIYPAEE